MNICNYNVKICTNSIKHSHIFPQEWYNVHFNTNAVDLTENKLYHVTLIKYTNIIRNTLNMSQQ